MTLSDTFPKITTPGTNRAAVQITAGDAFCYPLYYFISSITRDSRYLVYHRSDGKTVQLHRVDLRTGETAQLTNASATETQWHPWCVPAGTGVLDHRSVLNEATGEVIYFDGNTVEAVNVATLERRGLFELPADRVAIGQNCCSPDGSRFFYIHHDAELHKQIYGDPAEGRRGGYSYPRHLSRNTKLAAFELTTGEHRTVVALNSPVHHVQPYGDRMLVFSSLAVERAILVTDYDGGWYTHLRTQGEDGGTTCHYCVTDRGIFYEAHSADGLVAGVLDPVSKKPVEQLLPPTIRGGAPHVGADASGRRFFMECADKERGHVVLFVKNLGEKSGVEFEYLFEDWPTIGEGQKSHFHPRVTPDGEHLIITAGDPATQTNHIHLVDIHDLPETRFGDL